MDEGNASGLADPFHVKDFMDYKVLHFLSVLHLSGPSRAAPLVSCWICLELGLVAGFTFRRTKLRRFKAASLGAFLYAWHAIRAQVFPLPLMGGSEAHCL